MGKTSKATRILLLDQAMLDWPEIVQLRDQGHEVQCWTDAASYDLILGPNAWRMTEQLRPYLLSHALPEARKQADLRKKGTPPDARTD